MNTTTILVVDDQPEYLKAYATVFLEEGVPYKIISAINGKMAIELALKEKPDVIIMDWQMPVMDGVTALKEMKKNAELKQIPVIIASGIMLSSDDLKQALEAGASDYIRKPIDRVELMARTHSHLGIANYIKTITKQDKTITRERDERVDMLAESAKAISYQIEEMLQVFMKERQSMISGIENLRQKGTQDNEILDFIHQKLTQNQQIYKHYLTMGELHAKEDSYIKRLLKIHPRLLPSEIELCLLLKKNLSSKEISSLMFKATNTIKVARSKLRKKLNLGTKGNIYNYLNSI